MPNGFLTKYNISGLHQLINLSDNKKGVFMERIKSVVPMMAFLVYLGKALSLGMGLNDVLALLVLAGLYGFMEFSMQYKRIRKVEQEIKELSEKEQTNRKILDEARNNISSLKLSQGIRQQQGRM